MESRHLRSLIFGLMTLLVASASGDISVAEDAAAEAIKPSRVDAEIALDSIAGQKTFPFRCEGKSAKAAVVIFITSDCPIANRFAPEIERIRQDYVSKGVGLTLVHVAPDFKDDAAKSNAVEYGLKSTIVIDRKHELVRTTGATVTPEAIVIDPKGDIRYRGRINDLFAGYGDRRKEAKTHDLREALDAVLTGKAVAVPETRALGCFIED